MGPISHIAATRQRSMVILLPWRCCPIIKKQCRSWHGCAATGHGDLSDDDDASCEIGCLWVVVSVSKCRVMKGMGMERIKHGHNCGGLVTMPSNAASAHCVACMRNAIACEHFFARKVCSASVKGVRQARPRCRSPAHRQTRPLPHRSAGGALGQRRGDPTK